MRKLTERKRIEILCMVGFGDRSRTQTEVVELFNATHPDRPPISQSMVSRVEAKFREFGHVRDARKSGRKSITEEDQLNIVLAVQDNPNTTITDTADNVYVARSTVHKVLKREKFHPYKICLLHELSEDDFDRRNEFCERMQQLCNGDDNFVKIFFSDEATFALNGHVNRQNCRYWATENPHWFTEFHTQNPQKLNVWCGIVDGRVIGPYFFEETLNGAIYLDFLQNDLIPALITLFPDLEEPDIHQRDLFFQQDGAPPHYALPVLAYLDKVFPNR